MQNIDIVTTDSRVLQGAINVLTRETLVNIHRQVVSEICIRKCYCGLANALVNPMWP